MFLKLRTEPGIGEVSREKQAMFMGKQMFLKLRAEPGIGEVSHEKPAIFMGNRCFFVRRAGQGERGRTKNNRDHSGFRSTKE